MQWDYSQLKLARCIDDISIPNQIRGTYILKMEKWWWPKIWKKKTEKRQIKAQKKIWAALPTEEKTLYCLSRPVFDNNKKFSMIYLGESNNPTNGHSCIYLFKQINGHWQKIAEVDCRLS